jgi:hypothetical protein
LAKAEPARWIVVDAAKEEGEVWRQVKQGLERLT